MSVQPETEAQDTDKSAETARPEVSFFKLKAQLVDQGRTNTVLAETDNMWSRLKVYASGGENTLHTHVNEDHMFVIMQGSARFFGPEGEERDIGAKEGIMIPAGAYYHFQATSEEPLILLRVGARANPGDRKDRRNIKGGPLPGNSKENKQVDVIYRDGAYFE
jgi:mannose-6-phosphate isomerase-like protein (cupin superfamily)